MNRWTRVVVVAFAAMGMLAGCSSGAKHPPAVAGSPAPAFEDCPELVAAAKPLYFSDLKGTRLAGAMLGSGHTGIVLAHMSDGNACGWVPYAKDLGAAGYRVMIFSFQGFGESASATAGGTYADNVLGAAQYLRQHGATSVAYVGASMGGTSVLTAAAQAPLPAAVVSLSGPGKYAGLDAAGAAAKLTVPVLYVAAEHDVGFVDDARTMDAATPKSVPHELKIVPGGDHGLDMLRVDAPEGSTVRQEVTTFLRTHAPPTA
jgi:pimeloyl-ACP methyl ester carboxylesterase